MKLPAPRDQMAGCIWLPRIIAKARLLLRRELPAEYEQRFCVANGVDAQFLAHFGFTREEILAAAAQPDAAVIQWFQEHTASRPNIVSQWNETAVNLGRPGYPMTARLPVAKATTYQHLDTSNLGTLFEILEADEKDP